MCLSLANLARRCSGSHAVEEVIRLENGGGGSSKGEAKAASKAVRANNLQDLADQRANGSDPEPAIIPRGSVLIRDVRVCEPHARPQRRPTLRTRRRYAGHRGIHNPAATPRHMVAVCYSSASVRERCVVNSTGMSSPGDDRSKLRCQGGFSPPLDNMRFSDTCESIFARPSLHGVDRNVELVPGVCDNWGRSVDTVEVAPERVGNSWVFTNAATHSAQGIPIDAAADRRRTVPEDELPEWAVRIFREHSESRGGVATL